MDFATIVGLLLGGLIVLASFLLGGVPIQTILNPEAMLVVFGGTFASLLIHFSFVDIRGAIANISKAFQVESIEPEEVVDYIADAEVYIRLNGLLAVEPLLTQVDIPFLKKGLHMIIDNQPFEYMQSQLETDMEVQYKKDLHHASVFEAAGGFAPTMGIIGAILGLIKIMGLFHSPEQLGHGVGSAFIATLYGVGLANILLLPLAGKLKHRAKSEWYLKSMMLDGLMGLRAGENPSYLRERLETYTVQQRSPRSADYEVEYDDRPMIGAV